MTPEETKAWLKSLTNFTRYVTDCYKPLLYSLHIKRLNNYLNSIGIDSVTVKNNR